MKNSFGTICRWSALLASASSLAVPGIAHAQTAPEASGTEAEADTDASDIITVTGSRVIRDGSNSPTPVTVVSTEALEAVQPGVSLSDSLAILPAFAGSRGAGSNPSSTGSVGAGNGSANQLNLRNIGTEKTLVLIDGRRLAPTTFSGLVDVDAIPEMLIERVDVVTGGASAVYGSDAVSGVVNYVIDRDFTGLRARASYGIAEYGDAENLTAGIAWGTDIGERGHFMASYLYRDEQGILYRTDRPWMNLAGVTGLGTVAAPYQVQQDIRQKDFTFGGLISTSVLAGQTFDANGVLSPFQNGVSTGSSALQIGGDGAYWDSSLLQPSTGHQVFGRFDYDVSDSVTAYVQFAGNFKTDTNYSEHIRLNNVTFNRDNPFLPAQYRQQLVDAGQTTFRMRSIMGNGPRTSAESNSDQWMIFGGLAGEVGNFDWAIDYTHGESELHTTLGDNVNNQLMAYALDVVTSGGQTVCRIKVTNPGLADDCVPFNAFGPTATSQEAYDYVTGDVTFDALTEMNDVSASLVGQPFSTWAGPVTAALSAEYRTLSFISDSTSNLEDVVNCTGTRYNCTAGTTLWQGVFFSSPEVSEEVIETALEFEAPLVDDMLSINGAARFTDYENSGSYWTWKIGADLQISDTLRFRATRSRDIRAPTLYDLFAPSNGSTISPTDLLTGLTPIVQGITGSNDDLKAEIGNTLTGGLVWTPSNSLTVAIDAYRIVVSDAITQVQGWNEPIQRACYASGGSSPYCALQDRPNGFADTSAANAVTQWYSAPVNIAEIETYGIDLELTYVGEVANVPFSARVLGAWQPHLYYRQETVETRDQGGVAFGPLGTAPTPEWRATAVVHFEPTDRFAVDILQRWRSGMKISGIASEVWVNNHIGAFATTSMTLTYTADVAGGEADLFINVANLFDADPPVGGYTANGTRAGQRDGYASGDDVRGRYFTAGLRLDF